MATFFTLGGDIAFNGLFYIMSWFRFLYELEFLRVDGFAVVLWFDFNGFFYVQEIVRACLIHFGLRGRLRAS